MTNMTSFWDKLPKPFFALAPLYDVTDFAFREMIARRRSPSLEASAHRGGPDVMFTEFVSVDGLYHEKARAKLTKLHLGFSEIQRPIVAQLWGTKPELFFQAARLVRELDFNGVDVNMGCPDKKVVAAGAGAALIKNPTLAQEIITATQEGIGDLPISVKTRIGYERDTLDAWLPKLLEAKPAAVTVHARTVKEMSKVPADWQAVRRAVVIAEGSGTLIVGNGDINSLAMAKQRAAESGADGVMIGRGVFGGYWFFTGRTEIPLAERLQALVEHAEIFEANFAGIKNFAMLRKHFAAVVQGFAGAKDLRMKLMRAESAAAVREVINSASGGE
ncbi:MAG: tRNA-dihydrouridine synthase [Candidatus Liptonbacteria bacterium]|nr:tRNA-dihydrouridine synthase [Candidatus Liptonbacteria bacterium]